MTYDQSTRVDEFNLLTLPVVLGGGKCLFGAGSVPSALALVSSSTTSTSTCIATYRRAGKPKYGSFGL